MRKRPTIPVHIIQPRLAFLGIDYNDWYLIRHLKMATKSTREFFGIPKKYLPDYFPLDIGGIVEAFPNFHQRKEQIRQRILKLCHETTGCILKRKKAPIPGEGSYSHVWYKVNEDILNWIEHTNPNSTTIMEDFLAMQKLIELEDDEPQKKQTINPQVLDIIESLESINTSMGTPMFTKTNLNNEEVSQKIRQITIIIMTMLSKAPRASVSGATGIDRISDKCKTWFQIQPSVEVGPLVDKMFKELKGDFKKVRELLISTATRHANNITASSSKTERTKRSILEWFFQPYSKWSGFAGALIGKGFGFDKSSQDAAEYAEDIAEVISILKETPFQRVADEFEEYKEVWTPLDYGRFIANLNRFDSWVLAALHQYREWKDKGAINYWLSGRGTQDMIKRYIKYLWSAIDRAKEIGTPVNYNWFGIPNVFLDDLCLNWDPAKPKKPLKMLTGFLRQESKERSNSLLLSHPPFVGFFQGQDD